MFFCSLLNLSDLTTNCHVYKFKQKNFTEYEQLSRVPNSIVAVQARPDKHPFGRDCDATEAS
jgi:hypothetical protein